MILVVEDDEANQELVTRFFKRDGHRVFWPSMDPPA